MPGDLPFFSLIIPTFSRPQQLASCLEAVARLEYPRDRLEVIVVDDGNPQPLDGIVMPFRETLPVKLIRQANAGPGAARNTGAKNASGQYLAFTDDDCAPAEDWLLSLAARFAETPDAGLGGRTVNRISSPFSAASQLLIDYLYDYYSTSSTERFFTTNNLAVSAAQFQALGGFDGEWPLAAAEDREFCNRWLRQGFKLQFAPEAVVFHFHVLTLGSFWKQHFNYGRGAFYFHRKRARQEKKKHRIERASFYLRLMSYSFRKKLPTAARLSLLLTLSQAAGCLGYLREAGASRSRTRS